MIINGSLDDFETFLAAIHFIINHSKSKKSYYQLKYEYCLNDISVFEKIIINDKICNSLEKLIKCNNCDIKMGDPKVINCGHNLCDKCSNTKSCPTCKSEIFFKTSDLIITNILTTIDIKNINQKELFENNFLCSICTDVLYNPIVLQCGHNLCSNCIVNIDIENYICPFCRVPILDHWINNNINHFLESSCHIKCINDKCTWKSNLADYSVHKFNCTKKMVKCMHCEEKMDKLDIYEHYESLCPEKKSKCGKCFKKIKNKIYKEHFDKCKGSFVKCNLCFKEISINKYFIHVLLDCHCKYISCKICKSVIPEYYFETHSKYNHTKNIIRL